MLFFKCRISFNELVAMEKQLPEGSFCMTREPLEEFHYGVIRSSEFNKFLNVLSGETLEHLEYLSPEEFSEVATVLKNRSIHFTGNSELLV